MNVTVSIQGAVRNAEPVKERVSSEEWVARTELAALYRLVAYFRLTDFIANHISLRVPGGDDAFLINPYGYTYEEVTASSLVKVTVRGEVIDDPIGLGINRAGFVIHGAIHEARPDVTCIIHTHTRAGIAVAAQEDGLLPISQHAALVSPVAYHNYEGVSLDEDEQKRLVNSLGSCNSLILNNHGLLTVGRSPGEAMWTMLTLERACEAQVAALSGGTKVRIVSPEAMEATGRAVASIGANFWRDWEAMLRLVQRIAPDYSN